MECENEDHKSDGKEASRYWIGRKTCVTYRNFSSRDHDNDLQKKSKKDSSKTVKNEEMRK